MSRTASTTTPSSSSQHVAGEQALEQGQLCSRHLLHARWSFPQIQARLALYAGWQGFGRVCTPSCAQRAAAEAAPACLLLPKSAMPARTCVQMGVCTDCAQSQGISA